MWSIPGRQLSVIALLFLSPFSGASFAQVKNAPKVDEKKLNLLFDAIKKGDRQAVDQALQSGAGINDRLYATTVTPLGFAISEGKVDIVQYLVEKGANTQDVHEGRKALDYALGEEKISHEIVRFLVAREKSHADLAGKMVYAASMNHYPMIEALVKAGIDVNFRSEDDGKTALILAASEGWVETVRKLLDLGADLAIRDKQGKTALDYALLAQRNKIWREADYKSMGLTEQRVAEIVTLLRKGKPKKK